MLIEVVIKNIFSYKNEQIFSLVPGEHEDIANSGKYISTEMQKPNSLIRLAGFFGANASGKSNLFRAVQSLRRLVLAKNRSLDEDDRKNSFPPPFLLDNDSTNHPSKIEISFIANKKRFRYGIEFLSSEIKSEWLYCAKESRETMYFERDGQNIEFNARSFSEAAPFVVKKGDQKITKMTRLDTPFVSVLAQFDGKISKEIISWFRSVRFLSGIEEQGHSEFTSKKYLNDDAFKKWAMEMLAPFQIKDLSITEVQPEDKLNMKSIEDPELVNLVEAMKTFTSKHKMTSHKVSIIKHVGNTSYEFPLSFESAGTSKLIYILGPFYDAIINNRVMFIDEIDSKFHTLLTLHLLNHFYKTVSQSQIIFTAHDTNLLTEKILGRDQIWFCDKDETQGTNIYSLLEYKEYYARRYSSYSKDYLIGKYSAIPLFEDIEELRGYINA